MQTILIPHLFLNFEMNSTNLQTNFILIRSYYFDHCD